MPNILEIGAPGRTPTPELAHATRQLHAAAQAAAVAAAPVVAAAAAAAGAPPGAALPAAAAPGVVPPAVVPPAMTDAAFTAALIPLINAVNGALKGPSQDAREEIATWIPHFRAAGYSMTDPNVQRSFAYFLLSVVTDGFEREDITGTQMGRFLGSWRGGGFQ